MSESSGRKMGENIPPEKMSRTQRKKMNKILKQHREDAVEVQENEEGKDSFSKQEESPSSIPHLKSAKTHSTPPKMFGNSLVEQGQATVGQGQSPVGRGQVPVGQGQAWFGRGQVPFGQGQAPAGRGQVPVGQGQAPVGRGQVPVGQGQAPVGRGQVPVGQGQALVGRGQVPVGQGQAPVGRGQVPVGRGQVPVGQGQAPVGRWQVPVGQGQVPAGRGLVPFGQGQAPAGRGQLPVGQGQALVGRGQVPVGQGQASVGRGQVPVGQGQAPVGQGLALDGQGQAWIGQGQAPSGRRQFRGKGQRHGGNNRQSNSPHDNGARSSGNSGQGQRPLIGGNRRQLRNGRGGKGLNNEPPLPLNSASKFVQPKDMGKGVESVENLQGKFCVKTTKVFKDTPFDGQGPSYSKMAAGGGRKQVDLLDDSRRDPDGNMTNVNCVSKVRFGKIAEEHFKAYKLSKTVEGGEKEADIASVPYNTDGTSQDKNLKIGGNMKNEEIFKAEGEGADVIKLESGLSTIKIRSDLAAENVPKMTEAFASNVKQYPVIDEKFGISDASLNQRNEVGANVSGTNQPLGAMSTVNYPWNVPNNSFGPMTCAVSSGWGPFERDNATPKMEHVKNSDWEKSCQPPAVDDDDFERNGTLVIEPGDEEYPATARQIQEATRRGLNRFTFQDQRGMQNDAYGHRGMGYNLQSYAVGNPTPRMNNNLRYLDRSYDSMGRGIIGVGDYSSQFFMDDARNQKRNYYPNNNGGGYENNRGYSNDGRVDMSRNGLFYKQFDNRRDANWKTAAGKIWQQNTYVPPPWSSADERQDSRNVMQGNQLKVSDYVFGVADNRVLNCRDLGRGLGNHAIPNQMGNQNYGAMHNPGHPNVAFGNQSFGSQNFGNQSFGNQNFGNQSFGNQNFGNQSFGNQSFGNQGFGNRGIDRGWTEIGNGANKMTTPPPFENSKMNFLKHTAPQERVGLNPVAYSQQNDFNSNNCGLALGQNMANYAFSAPPVNPFWMDGLHQQGLQAVKSEPGVQQNKSFLNDANGNPEHQQDGAFNPFLPGRAPY